MTDLTMLQKQLREFVSEREWEKFHTPKNLAIALTIEAAELLENFLWKSEEEDRSAINIEKVAEEVGDVMIYLCRLCDVLGLDLIRCATQKVEINRKKYPAERVRGKSKKYTEYDE